MSRYQLQNLPATKSDVGQAGEYLVAADLLASGFIVTKPLNTNGKHDLHAKVCGEWLTVQVKTGRMDTKRNELALSGSWTRIASEILAVVYMPTKAISYYRRSNRRKLTKLEDYFGAKTNCKRSYLSHAPESEVDKGVAQ